MHTLRKRPNHTARLCHVQKAIINVEKAGSTSRGFPSSNKHKQQLATGNSTFMPIKITYTCNECQTKYLTFYNDSVSLHHHKYFYSSYCLIVTRVAHNHFAVEDMMHTHIPENSHCLMHKGSGISCYTSYLCTWWWLQIYHNSYSAVNKQRHFRLPFHIWRSLES